MSIKEQIEQKLRAAFAPAHLDVIDDSESHRGHAGFQEGGQSHFNVAIKSDVFAGLHLIYRPSDLQRVVDVRVLQLHQPSFPARRFPSPDDAPLLRAPLHM